jgi:hypothetical protein
LQNILQIRENLLGISIHKQGQVKLLGKPEMQIEGIRIRSIKRKRTLIKNNENENFR